MEVRLEHDWASDGYRIWLLQRHPLRVLRPPTVDRGSWWSEPVVEDAVSREIEPSLVLPVEALQALLQEAGKVLPATHATERHLTDAIDVRDRLLTLVEDGWSS